MSELRTHGFIAGTCVDPSAFYLRSQNSDFVSTSAIIAKDSNLDSD